MPCKRQQCNKTRNAVKPPRVQPKLVIVPNAGVAIRTVHVKPVISKYG